MAEIKYAAVEVWDFIRSNLDEISERPQLVANDSDAGVQVYIGADGDIPHVHVYMDGELKMEAELTIERVCFTVMSSIYENFMGGVNKFVNDMLDIDDDDDKDADPNNWSEFDQVESIDDREQELTSAVEDCLSVFEPDLAEKLGDEYDDTLDDIKDVIAEYLFKIRGVSIHRPMYLETEDGGQEFHTHPYPEIDFDAE